MVVSIRVDASDALQDLRAKPKQVEEGVRRWVQFGGQYVRTTMVELIRRRQKTVGRTGYLSASVRVDAVKGGFQVYPLAEYAPFVDQPTRPHLIRPREKKALAFPMAGGQISRSRAGTVRTRFRFGGKQVFTGAVFARSVRHPGTRGMFFIQGTADIVARPLAEALDREIRKTTGAT